MTPVPDRASRQKMFMVFTLVCVIVAMIYVVWAGNRPGPVAQTQDPVVAPAATADRLALQSQPHLVVINREAPYVDYVRLVSVDSTNSRIFQTSLKCDRMHYAAGNGICLMRDTIAPGSAETVRVTLFDSSFQPVHTSTVEGYPTRTRISLADCLQHKY